MSNISGQLIKDTFNYVLQSDLVTGIVFRIGGSVAENPKFISGLTVNTSFTYSDGSEFPGYVLTCDALGNGVWAPVSATTSSVVVTGGTFDYSAGTLQLRNSNGTQVTISGLEDVYVTGGTVSGTSIVFSYNDTNTFEVTDITPYSVFSNYTASTQVTINNKLDTSGFTAYTATTQPLINNSITGGSFNNNTKTLTLINNSGGTVPITGFTDTFLTGGTYTNGNISFTNNLGGGFVVSGISTTSGGSVSGLSYYVSASTPNNVTLISGDRWFNTDTGVELVWIDDGDSSQWVQPFSVPGPLSPDAGYYETTGITTSQTISWDKTYWGISGSTNINLILPTTTSKNGYYLIVKDEAGICGSYRIRITPSSGLIDGNDYVDMNINYMSLTLMVRGGNWFLI